MRVGYGTNCGIYLIHYPRTKIKGLIKPTNFISYLKSQTDFHKISNVVTFVTLIVNHFLKFSNLYSFIFFLNSHLSHTHYPLTIKPTFLHFLNIKKSSSLWFLLLSPKTKTTSTRAKKKKKNQRPNLSFTCQSLDDNPCPNFLTIYYFLDRNRTNFTLWKLLL